MPASGKIPAGAKRAAGWIALAGLSTVLLSAGYWLMFTAFMEYDDEGYVLISLRNYAEHGRLYDAVFSQYGPFFFAFYDALHRLLGYSWTHTNGRILTLVVWSLVAFMGTAVVWRRTRSFGATAFTLAGVFTSLWVMVDEPTHPGGLVALLVAAAAWIGVEADPAERRWAATVLGALGGALSLTKINVGAFLLLAGAAWLLLNARSARLRAAAPWIVGVILVSLPWGLMGALLDQEWVATFAVLSGLASIGAVLAVRTGDRAAAGGPHGMAFVAGAAGVAVPTAVWTLARGTSLAGLWTGVVLNPLRQPYVYNFPMTWAPEVRAAGIVSVALVAWWLSGRARSAATRVIAGARFVAVTVLGLSIARTFSFGSETIGMNYGVGLAGLCALPLREDEAGSIDARSRQWLGLLLVLQFLHAYPVAGSQASWAVFLWIPLTVLAARDAWAAVVPAGLRVGPYVARLSTVAAFVVAGAAAIGALREGLAHRDEGEPLGLPGAEGIVVADDAVFGIRTIAANARYHASMLFGIPGQYSFNLWTGVPTPTLANANQWFTSLREDQQQAIVERLRAEPNAAIIVQVQDLLYLEERGFKPSGPLAAYLGSAFEWAFEVDRYAFWVKRGRTIAPLHTGALVPDAGGRRRLELILPLGSDPIEAIELWELGGGARRRLRSFGRSDARLDATALSDDGRPTGATAALPWGVAPPAGIVRLGVAFQGESGDPRPVVALLKAADGRRIGEARVLR